MMNDFQAYARVHQYPLNLLIHVLTVPLFVVGTTGFLVFLITGYYVNSILSIAVPLLALALQGIGHRLEEHRPEPFKGPKDFITRIFTEQYYRFWVFLYYKLLGKLNQ